MKEGGKAAILIQELGQPKGQKQKLWGNQLLLLLQAETTIIFQRICNTYRC
jgi:hypothetical protein